jgi:hypothetical protein
MWESWGAPIVTSAPEMRADICVHADEPEQWGGQWLSQAAAGGAAVIDESDLCLQPFTVLVYLLDSCLLGMLILYLLYLLLFCISLSSTNISNLTCLVCLFKK